MAVNRMTGLSGFDVDSMVTDLMKAERTRTEVVKANRQTKVWEQEAYRDVTKTLSTFQSEYFDYLKPETNLRSPNAFAMFTSTVALNGVASTKVSVSGTGEATNFNHQISKITQLASKDSYVGAEADLASVNGAVFTDDISFMAAAPTTFSISLTVDKTTKTISIPKTDYTNITEFTAKFNAAAVAQFGAGFENVARVDTEAGGSRLKLMMPSSTVKVLSQTGSEDSLTWIGIASGTTSQDYVSKTLTDQFGMTDTQLQSMSVNGKSLYDMGIRTTDTIAKMTQKVNASDANVNFSYNTLKDRFEVKSNLEGSANNMTLSADFQTMFKLDTGTHTTGANAVLNLDGVDIVKSSNNFTVDGFVYTLNETYDGVAGDLDVSLKPDSQKVLDKIKTFMNTYNGIIKTIGDKLTEKVNRSFKPLTDDQKKEMKPEEILIWETKAKSGILRNQKDLETMLTGMRRAFSDTVEGAGISLSEIGITNTANYKELGKLEILDESKLKSAIENNYTGVVKLFSSTSTVEYQDTTGTAQRFNESGIANRLNDILQDMVRTRPGNSNSKGILLEIAGKVGDATNTTSVLSKKIAEYDNRIDILMSALVTKENDYYNKFSKMESALARLNSQSSYLTSQFG